MYLKTLVKQKSTDKNIEGKGGKEKRKSDIITFKVISNKSV